MIEELFGHLETKLKEVRRIKAARKREEKTYIQM